MKQIPLFKIYWDKDDIKAVNSVIRRGSHWADGPEISEFESQLANYLKVNYVVALNSGTSAQHAILHAYDIKKDDEVIVPSFTFISTANSVKFVDATPVLTDIELKTYGLNLTSIKASMTEHTKAVIPVHYGGCPCLHIEAIKEYAREHNILMIEDSAAALGAKVGKKLAGTFGDAGIFSFCQNKIITCGEGGAVATNNQTIAERIRRFRSHGQLGSDYYSLGYNFRMPSMNAALGISQLSKIDRILKMRNQIAKWYSKQLSKIPEIQPPSVPKGFYSSFWVYTIRVKDMNKRALMGYLETKGISTKLYYPPVNSTTYYNQDYNKLINTLIAQNNCISLPMYPTLTKEEVNYITTEIKDFIGR